MAFFYTNYSQCLIMLDILSNSREIYHVCLWIYQ